MANKKNNKNRYKNKNRNTNIDNRVKNNILIDLKEDLEETENNDNINVLEGLKKILDDEDTGINDIEISVLDSDNLNYDDSNNDNSEVDKAASKKNKIKEKDDMIEIQQFIYDKANKEAEQRATDVIKNCRRVLKEKQDKKEEEKTEGNVDTNKILWCVLGGLVIVLIIALIMTNLNPKEGDKNEETSTMKPIAVDVDKETNATEVKLNLVAEDEDSEITKLFKNYIKAARVDVSMKKVKKYVDDTSNIELDVYKRLKDYIEDFKDITCYKMNSVKDNMFIVLVTYSCKFNNVETAAPGIETFVVVEKDSKYYVHNMTKSENVKAFISGNTDLAKINAYNAEVEKKLESAVKSDEKLKDIYSIIKKEESEN